MGYQLIDSGGFQKFELFNGFKIVRPALNAVWKPTLTWEDPDACFTREEGWEFKKNTQKQWITELQGMRFHCEYTPFGHLGIFPEQLSIWRWLQKNVASSMKILNLFAYSGGSTFAAAQAGARVCHVDASKKMVAWAKENAQLNGLEDKIRWIEEDVFKFLKRQIRRQEKYDGIILDPPTFGRGTKNEVFKIEEDLSLLLELLPQLLSSHTRFVILSCHTPGWCDITLRQLLGEYLGVGTLHSGPLVLEGPLILPSGYFAQWSR